MLTAEQLTQEMAKRTGDVNALEALWKSVVETDCPTEQQLCVWLDLHPLHRVVFGIRETGRKFLRLNRQMTKEHMVKFASSVMNSQKTKEQGKAVAA
jgi:hypothetical protein